MEANGHWTDRCIEEIALPRSPMRSVNVHLNCIHKMENVQQEGKYDIISL